MQPCDELKQIHAFLLNGSFCKECYIEKLERNNYEAFFESLEGPQILSFDTVNKYKQKDGVVLVGVATSVLTLESKIGFYGLLPTRNYQNETFQVKQEFETMAESYGIKIHFR